MPTIHITLLPDGSIGYDSVDLHAENTFQALVGCYVVAGKLLQKLREDMKYSTNDCDAQ